MRKERLEAFSDGVIAVIITISVLEMKVPHGTDIGALMPVLPVFLTYALSFTYVGIYWNNHHHLLQATASINGKVMWANLHLLFWLSLLPFATGWMGENHFERAPTVLYGLDLLLCAISYSILEAVLIRHQGEGSTLARALRHDMKAAISPVLYILGILAALFVTPWVGIAFFVATALMWLIPDRRLERELARQERTRSTS
jgi:TMEM175 potassium channel family protein